MAGVYDSISFTDVDLFQERNIVVGVGDASVS